jgi:hypothetical protein
MFTVRRTPATSTVAIGVRKLMRFHRLGLAEALNVGVGAAPSSAGAPMPIVDAAKPTSIG